MNANGLLCFLLLSLVLAQPACAQAENVIQFDDGTVETVVRELLAMPDGAITRDDMLRIESFQYPVFEEGIIQPNAAQSLPQIHSIGDLRHCLNLQSLDLFGQPISSLDPLETLERLQSVTLVYCPNVTSVAPLSNSQSLQRIVLIRTPVSDFSPVLALPGLKEFIATKRGPAPDLSALAGTSGIETFYLRELSAPVDYAPLANHPNIKRAELSFVAPEMFEYLVNSWPQLQMIDISSSSITSNDLHALADRNLTHIKMYDCPGIDDLSPLIAQTSMVSLFVQQCNVQDVSPLAKIPSLTQRIDLIDNPIDDLSPLKALTDLKHLVVSRNEARYTLDDLRKLLPNTEIILR